MNNGDRAMPDAAPIETRAVTLVRLLPENFAALDIATNGDWTTGLNAIVRDWLSWQATPQGPPRGMVHHELDELTTEEWDTFVDQQHVHTLATVMRKRGTPLPHDDPRREHLVIGVALDPEVCEGAEHVLTEWHTGMNTILREWLARQQPSTPPVTAAA
ncbi:MAG: hypothetical protein KJT01_05110 [Gemmatimonadetes bacterium]|nr:hypothetical protein [Gemmatimonadota bacterium]